MEAIKFDDEVSRAVTYSRSRIGRTNIRVNCCLVFSSRNNHSNGGNDVKVSEGTVSPVSKLMTNHSLNIIDKDYCRASWRSTTSKGRKIRYINSCPVCDNLVY